MPLLARPAWERVHAAKALLFSHIAEQQSALDVPFGDDRLGTPWTVLRADMTRLDDALAAVAPSSAAGDGR